MNGNLEPEERVMNSVVFPGNMLGQLALALEELGWDNPDVEVVLGGTSTYEIEGDGSKWKPLKGTKRYNKDAFIIIRKVTGVESSTPMDDFSPHHDPYEWDHADHPIINSDSSGT